MDPPKLAAGSLVAVDVNYDEHLKVARTGCATFDSWQADVAAGSFTHDSALSAPYVAGAFYRRELPAIEAALRCLMRGVRLRTVIVDAHVWLDAGRKGLGAHLFECLDGRVEVVGVAKNPFRGSGAIPVLRGTSRRPLWVSSTGDPTVAAEAVARMAGEHRIPNLLKHADHVCRGLVPAAPIPEPDPRSATGA